jgi:sigma-B regulation protein RsbU (phosphoserine phosphatase)
MLSAINCSLNERKIEAQYVTLAYAIWDDERRRITVANSGIPRPFFCRNGKIERIEATGLPLGLFEEADYDEITVEAQSGDLFVFASDGIFDALNPQGDQFGRSLLENVLINNAAGSAHDVVKAIFDAVSTHRQHRSTFDDETVLAMKVK